jgi:acyl carrier protein
MEIQNTVIAPSSSSTEIDYPDTKLDPKDYPRTKTAIQTWLVSYLAELLGIDLDEIDITIPFNRYGLDSATAIALTGDLGDWLGAELDPTLLYDYPTIQALVQYLVEAL